MTQPPQIDPAELERLLAQANPFVLDDLPEVLSPEGAALYARLQARLDGRRVTDHRLGRRRRLLAASLLLVGGAALGAVTVGPWWQDAPAPVNPRVGPRRQLPVQKPLIARARNFASNRLSLRGVEAL